jgi:peptide/nickel transport system substrate-binding protein
MGGALAGLKGPSLAFALLCALTACRSTPTDRSGAAPANSPKTGGDLVVSMRAEPRSLSWYAQHDAGTQLISLLTQSRLVRVNAATQELEPWLADSWVRTDDGLRYTLKLHPQVTFSDGVPFTSEDVVFSVNAAHDKASALADTLSIAGGRLRAQSIR